MLTDIDMQLMVEKNIGGISHIIHWSTKANNKYMKDYDKIKESPYLKYYDANNFYGWAMLQKLQVNNFEWIEDTSKFNEGFMKNYNEESDEGYSVEVDIQYPENLHDFHNDLPFLPERIKTEKVEKIIPNLHDKTEYVIHIWNLKQALDHGLVLNDYI